MKARIKRHFLLHRKFWIWAIAIGSILTAVLFAGLVAWLAKTAPQFLLAIPLILFGAFLMRLFYVAGDEIYDFLKERWEKSDEDF